MSNDSIRLTFGLLFFIVAVLLLIPVFAASGQVARPGDLSGHEQRLALNLARVAYNEAHGSDADLEMIAQTVFGQRFTGAGDDSGQLQAAHLLVWLRSHSPCVTGRLTQEQAYARPGNCAWTRNMRSDGRLPRGFTAASGIWRNVHREEWLDHLRQSVEYVRAPETADLCDETPESWDGSRVITREELEANGWRVLECREPTENFPVVRATAGS